MEYEYGIASRNSEEGIILSGMAQNEAEQWLKNCEDYGYVREDFQIVARVVGPWKRPDTFVNLNDVTLVKKQRGW